MVQKPTLAGVYYYSMALVIMGGLAVSTFLTLVLLPTTVTLVEDGSAGAGRAVSWIAHWLRHPRRLAWRPRRSPVPDIAEA